jgi:hypothetical protein
VQKVWCALALVLLLAGCDGHLVRLRIKEQPAVFHRKEIGVCAGQDVVGPVRAVARLLALVERTPTSEIAPRAWDAPDGRFGLSLVRETNGCWTVDLADWPSSTRSELSFQAEAEIRKALKSDCTL